MQHIVIVYIGSKLIGINFVSLITYRTPPEIFAVPEYYARIFSGENREFPRARTAAQRCDGVPRVICENCTSIVTYHSLVRCFWRQFFLSINCVELEIREIHGQDATLVEAERCQGDVRPVIPLKYKSQPCQRDGREKKGEGEYAGKCCCPSKRTDLCGFIRELRAPFGFSVSQYSHARKFTDLSPIARVRES